VTVASILQRPYAATARAIAAPPARGPATGGQAIGALLGRVAGGAVFIVFGAGKFTNHASELASVNTYHLPAPDPFVYLIGVIELAGGLLPPQPWRCRPAPGAKGEVPCVQRT
jgi:DoxX